MSNRICSSLVTLALFAACAGASAAGARPPDMALLDDEGAAMPSDPRAEPADPAWRVAGVRYTRAGPAQALARALGPRAVWVEAGAAPARDGAQRALARWRAAGPGAVVLVAGRDARNAAALAAELVRSGVAPAWLVVQ